MPVKGLRICGCGKSVPGGQLCKCEADRAKERKARHDANRPSARERGYTNEWQRESRLFLQGNPICKRCGNPAQLVDHVIAHKGDQRLFWNRANWQPLCRPCHNRWKQSAERRVTEKER